MKLSQFMEAPPPPRDASSRAYREWSWAAQGAPERFWPVLESAYQDGLNVSVGRCDITVAHTLGTPSEGTLLALQLAGFEHYEGGGGIAPQWTARDVCEGAL